jgi:hypothetical protein
MSRASDAALDALHALMAESMTDELRRGIERARLPKSHDDYEPLSPKLLAVIRAFLKDNGIDAPAASERFSGLASQLADLDLDEAAMQRPSLRKH